MKKKIELTNSEIYNNAVALMNMFDESAHIPMKLGFYLQKNLKVLNDLGKEIEEARMTIIENYGEKNDEGYTFTEENGQKANEELADLFAVKQDIEFYPLKVEWFDDVELTAAQVNALTCMIEEE